MSAPNLLSPEQQFVITLLAEGASIADAAETVGIHRNTIGHWRRTIPAFAQTLAAARYDRIVHYRELTEQHAELAISTLRDLLTDPKTPPGIRLKAALAVLKECTTPLPPEPTLPDDSSDFLHQDPGPFSAPAPFVSPAIVHPALPHNLHNSAQSSPRPVPRPGRNAPCPCRSGKKYKQCCLNAAQAA